MQQGMKLPEVKERERTIVLPPVTITANVMTARVKSDLEEKSGVKISGYDRLLGNNLELFNNKNTPMSEKREILQDLITILNTDIAKMKEARREDSDIRAKDKGPRYKKAMDTYLSDLEAGVGRFRQALIVLNSETVSGAPKRA